MGRKYLMQSAHRQLCAFLVQRLSTAWFIRRVRSNYHPAVVTLNKDFTLKPRIWCFNLPQALLALKRVMLIIIVHNLTAVYFVRLFERRSSAQLSRQRSNVNLSTGYGLTVAIITTSHLSAHFHSQSCDSAASSITCNFLFKVQRLIIASALFSAGFES